MKTIKIQIGNESQVFTSSLDAIGFIASNRVESSKPKPLKVTKKYTVWKSVEDFAKSEGL